MSTRAMLQGGGGPGQRFSLRGFFLHPGSGELYVGGGFKQQRAW